MPELSVLARIARKLSDDQLVSNLNRLTAELDEWAIVAGVNPDDCADLRRERAMAAALRAEFRARSGEVV